MSYDLKREVLIEVVSWYDSVNNSGTIAIDDYARLKAIVERARGALDSTPQNWQWVLDFEQDIDQFEDE